MEENNVNVGATAPIPTQPPMPQPYQAPTSSGSNVLMWILGFVFLGALLYLLMQVLKGKGGEGLRTKLGGGNKGGQDQSSSQSSASQVSYGSAPQTAPTSNTNVVATKGYFSAELKKAQQNLMDTCGAKFPQYGADGFLGEEFISFVAKIGAEGAEMAQKMRATNIVTREQMDWLQKPCTSSKSTATVKADGTLNNSKVVDDVTESDLKRMNKTALETYIMRKNGWSLLVGLFWTESDLRNWAIALHKNRAEFEVRGSYIGENGIYSTRTGTIVRYF